MVVVNKYILAFVLVSVFNNVASGAGDEYAKAKVDLMEKALKAFTNQKEVIARIVKKADGITKGSSAILDDFTKSTANLRPALRHKATEPFLNIIQDYLNSFTDMRQKAGVALKRIEIHKERALKEFQDSEKRYTKASKTFRESTDNKRAVESTIGQVKSLMITRDRLNEIEHRITKLEKATRIYVEKILGATKKVVSYRYMLELVTKGRNAIVASKNVYIDSFSLKDRILYGFNRVESILKKTKLLVGEAKKRGLYKVDLEKIEALAAKITKLGSKIASIKKESVKNWESMKELVEKMEQSEKKITDLGRENKKTPNTGYTKAKSYYHIIIKLRKLVDEIDRKLKVYKKASVEIVKDTNTMFREIDTIIKRKTILVRKVPMLVNPVQVKVNKVNTDTIELDDVKSTVSQSDNESDDGSDTESEADYQVSTPSKKSKERRDLTSSDSESESGSESESEFETASEGEGSVKEKKVVDLLDEEEVDVDVGDLTKRKRKRRTRQELDKSKKGAKSEASKKKKGSIVSDVDSESDSGSESDNASVRSGSYNVTPEGSDISDLESEYEEAVSKKNKKVKKTVTKTKSKSKKRTGIDDYDFDDEEEIKIKKKKGRIGKAFGFLKSVLTGPGSKESSLTDRLVQLEPSAPPAEDTDGDKSGSDKEKAKSDMEIKLDGLNVGGKTRGDVLKLIELAYALKTQFELVRKEFQKSARHKAIELIRRVLMESLHLYLTGVCTVVLEITRTSAETGKLPTVETIDGLVTKM